MVVEEGQQGIAIPRGGVGNGEGSAELPVSGGQGIADSLDMVAVGPAQEGSQGGAFREGGVPDSDGGGRAVLGGISGNGGVRGDPGCRQEQEARGQRDEPG